jgi:hypothetical protein
MADIFGSMTVPTVAPVTGELVGFPELGLFADFCKTVLPVDAGESWEAIAPDVPIVVNVYTHDPKLLFDDSKLPALYIWPGQSNFERLYDGVCVTRTTLEFLWVMEPAQEETLALRQPAQSMVARLLSEELYQERHASWKVTGDTDPFAADWGSSLSAYCGILDQILPGEFKPVFENLPVPGSDGKPIPFVGVHGTVSFGLGLTKGPPPGAATPPKLDATITESGRTMEHFTDGITP